MDTAKKVENYDQALRLVIFYRVIHVLFYLSEEWTDTLVKTNTQFDFFDKEFIRGDKHSDNFILGRHPLYFQ